MPDPPVTLTHAGVTLKPGDRIVLTGQAAPPLPWYRRCWNWMLRRRPPPSPRDGVYVVVDDTASGATHMERFDE